MAVQRDRDFFFWGHIKDLVSLPLQPKTLEDLSESIHAVWMTIDATKCVGQVLLPPGSETSETLTELDILDSMKNKNNTSMNCDEDDVEGNNYDAEMDEPSYDEMLKSFETTRR
ncbi:hypothetical protein AVEN_148019-1 [Araneus ventricosus]|uniref:DDE-1 domain-containing protein n=1 Tax=Araneus ventricosus TaxID=182803 RepID=A0A4Y2U4X4_ARAVE|nr:hypothetical protein AVEN_148019-1 [Araneus ventricosus]